MAAKELRVDIEALQTMSIRWASLAGGLQTRSPDVSVASCPSAAAVAAGGTEIGAATAALSARVRAGAAKVADAAHRYSTSEANSAVILAAQADGPHG